MAAQPYDPENIFAKIIRGEIPCHKIFETEHALAILDAFPMTPGHSLLLPKAPCASVLDMPPTVAAAVLSELPRLAQAVQLATGAPGVNIVQNNGSVAGQVVFHAHFHVIPRQKDDGLVTLKPSASKMLSPEEAGALLTKMQGPGADAPYSKTLAAIDALAADMRAGTVSPPPKAAPKGKEATGAAVAAPAGKKGTAPAPAAAPTPAATVDGKGKAGGKGASGEKGAGGKGGPPEGKVFNTEKKVKEKKAAPEKGAAPVEERPIDWSWADVRVGVITDVAPHPQSDKLYVEQIDVGDAEGPRQILSGLAHHMKLEEVQGARVTVICNLKPRPMAGIVSNGMVLCASDKDKSALAFVVPPEGAKPGERVMVAGYEGAPMEVKKMDKKKGWDAVQPEFSTDGAGVACYKGVAWEVAGGKCTSKVAGGIIS